MTYSIDKGERVPAICTGRTSCSKGSNRAPYCDRPDESRLCWAIVMSEGAFPLTETSAWRLYSSEGHVKRHHVVFKATQCAIAIPSPSGMEYSNENVAGHAAHRKQDAPRRDKSNPSPLASPPFEVTLTSRSRRVKASRAKRKFPPPVPAWVRTASSGL